MQRLRPAHHRRQRLQSDPHHIVLRLLSGQRRTGGLRVEAQHPGAWVLRLEAFAHDPGPHAPGSAELGDLFQEIIVRIEEERKLLGKTVHVQPGLDRCLHIGDAVRQRESHLLHRRRTGLADMVAGDADRVPVRHFGLAEAENIRNQAHRRRRREDIGAAGDIFLQNIVLDRTAQLPCLHTLPLCHRDIHRQQHRRRGVDRHTGRHLAQRDFPEQRRHIIQRRDRHAHLAHLAHRNRVIGIVADLRRQVESHRKSRLPLLQQIAVALVRLLGAGVPGILAHRPEAPAEHRWLHAARKRIFAREAQLPGVIRLALRRRQQARQRDTR